MSVDQIAGFLSHWNAGEVFLVIVGVVCVGKKIYEFGKKAYGVIEGGITKKLKGVEQMDSILSDIDSLKNDLNAISTDVESYKKNLDDRVKAIISQSDTGDSNIEKVVDELQESLQMMEPKVRLLEDKMSKIESQISILINSDVEYTKAYITDCYNKFVKVEHHIDLISLQNVESVYNKFVQETGLEDEFLSKLMRELRNLPTTKDQNM